MKDFLIIVLVVLAVGLGVSGFYNYQQWEGRQQLVQENQHLEKGLSILNSRVDGLKAEGTRHKIDALRAIRDRDALMSKVREWEAWAESVKTERAALQTQLRELEKQSATGGGGGIEELAGLIKLFALFGGL